MVIFYMGWAERVFQADFGEEKEVLNFLLGELVSCSKLFVGYKVGFSW